MLYPTYAVTVAGLGMTKSVLAGRAAKLEKTFARAALRAEAVAKQLQTRPGNAAAQDVFTAAKGHYELGRLVQDRDRLEAKYAAWQTRADRVGHLRHKLTRWQGRTVPYLLGVADAALVAAALVWFGVSPEQVKDAVQYYAQR